MLHLQFRRINSMHGFESGERCKEAAHEIILNPFSSRFDNLLADSF